MFPNIQSWYHMHAVQYIGTLQALLRYCPGNARICNTSYELYFLTIYHAGKVLLTHFVISMKHQWNKVQTSKKTTTSWLFFSLPAFGQCCSSVSYCPARHGQIEYTILQHITCTAIHGLALHSKCLNKRTSLALHHKLLSKRIPSHL